MRGVLLLCCVALALTACKKSADEALAEAAIKGATGHDVSVDKDGEQVTIKTDDGAMTISGGESATLPASFPQDVFLPGKYSVESVVEMNSTQLIALTTEGEVATLYADARTRMEKEGWKQTMAMQGSANDGLLAYEKGERKATVSFNAEPETQTVAVGLQIIGPEEKAAAN